MLERKKSEKSLRDSEKQRRLLLQSASEAIHCVNIKGKCTFPNPAYAEPSGLDHQAELVGRNMQLLIHNTGVGENPSSSQDGKFSRACKSGELATADDEVLWRQDGTGFPVEYRSIPVMDDGRFIGRVVTFEDISEQRRAEKSERQLRNQLAHAARLSVVGNMATGMAHEINQPLTAINGYTQACIRRLRSRKGTIEEIVVDLEKVTEQVARAADIIKWLRNSVRKEEAERTELDINACIAEVAHFMRADIRSKNSDLVLQFEENLPQIMANKVQIQQVLINLIQNSLQASVRGSVMRHEITIRTSFESKGMVRVETMDNGPGLPDEILCDLFEPFFSTTDEGLGLGLSISSSIIEAHAGRLWARSDYKQGAAFVFVIPVIE